MVIRKQEYDRKWNQKCSSFFFKLILFVFFMGEIGCDGPELEHSPCTLPRLNQIYTFDSPSIGSSFFNRYFWRLQVDLCLNEDWVQNPSYLPQTTLHSPPLIFKQDQALSDSVRLISMGSFPFLEGQPFEESQDLDFESVSYMPAGAYQYQKQEVSLELDWSNSILTLPSFFVEESSLSIQSLQFNLSRSTPNQDAYGGLCTVLIKQSTSTEDEISEELMPQEAQCQLVRLSNFR